VPLHPIDCIDIGDARRAPMNAAHRRLVRADAWKTAASHMSAIPLTSGAL